MGDIVNCRKCQAVRGVDDDLRSRSLRRDCRGRGNFRDFDCRIMKKYRVYLLHWDWQAEIYVEAESATKAKGQFIKKCKSLIEDYGNGFFIYLRAERLPDNYTI